MSYIPEISASKVAGFIGLHKYQAVHEVFYDLLLKDKNIKEKVRDIERTHRRKPLMFVKSDVLKDSDIRDCISTALKECQASEDVSDILDRVEQRANVVLALRHSGLKDNLRQLMAAEVRGQVSRQRGVQNESTILDAYEKERNVQVIERNTKSYKKDYGQFKLNGRTDGFVPSENRIVDSKDRTRVWDTVPIYDEIQMRVYMNMADVPEAELVENFPNGTTRHTKYTNDADKWSQIENAIRSQTALLNQIIEDPEKLKTVVFANTVEV